MMSRTFQIINLQDILSSTDSTREDEIEGKKNLRQNNQRTVQTAPEDELERRKKLSYTDLSQNELERKKNIRQDKTKKQKENSTYGTTDNAKGRAREEEEYQIEQNKETKRKQKKKKINRAVQTASKDEGKRRLI